MFGVSYISAVYINSIISISSGFLILKIVHLKIMASPWRMHLAIIFAASFLLNPFYLEEVYSGRSIPLAVFLVIASFFINIKFSNLLGFFIGGILLGCSVVVRFDLLLFGFLVIILTNIIFCNDKTINYVSRSLAISIFGFVIGFLPWIIFSLKFHNSLFASSNSIAALSSVQVVFTGFNDLVEIKRNTLFTNPLDWFLKLFNNVPFFIKNLFIALLCQPFFIALYYFVLESAIVNNNINNKKLILFGVLMLVALAPHLASGFFDHRYFTFYFLICLLFVVNRFDFGLIADRKISKAILGLLVVTPLIFTLYYVKFLHFNLGKNTIDAMIEKIIRVSSCHVREPNVAYIFLPGSDINDSTYAGFTDFNVAFPVGYNKWSERDKLLFFDAAKPFRVVNKDSSLFNCLN
jgi:hypothetical protein